MKPLRTPLATLYGGVAFATLALSMLAMSNIAQGDTVVSDGKVIELNQTLSDVRHLWVGPDDFTRINGFELKPEGACFKEMCVPLRQDRDSDMFVTRDGKSWLNASAFADKVGQPYVVDRDSGTWSFGMVPATRKAFLDSAIAPDFALTDRNGDMVKLSDFRGKKVLIITWASW